MEEEQKQEEKRSSSPSTTSSARKVEILLDVSEPELWFLEDTSRASSSAIVLSSERVRCRHYEWNEEEAKSHQILDAFKCKVQVCTASNLLAVQGGFYSNTQKSESTSLIVVEPFHLFTEKIQSKMYFRCSHMRDVFGRTWCSMVFEREPREFTFSCFHQIVNCIICITHLHQKKITCSGAKRENSLSHVFTKMSIVSSVSLTYIRRATLLKCTLKCYVKL